MTAGSFGVRLRPSVLAVALAAALAGCAATVAPTPPLHLQVPAEWRTRVGPQEGAAAVEQQWWQAFHDPVLNDLVTRALANNGDLRVARARAWWNTAPAWSWPSRASARA